jgi:hypothetical protein
MKITVAELMLIIDTLDKSLRISGIELFTFDKATREKVLNHLVQLSNHIGVNLEIGDDKTS